MSKDRSCSGVDGIAEGLSKPCDMPPHLYICESSYCHLFGADVGPAVSCRGLSWDQYHLLSLWGAWAVGVRAPVASVTPG